VLIRVSITVHI